MSSTETPEEALKRCMKAVAWGAGAGHEIEWEVIDELRQRSMSKFEANHEKWERYGERVVVASAFVGRMARIFAGPAPIKWIHIQLAVQHAQEVCTAGVEGSYLWCPDI